MDEFKFKLGDVVKDKVTGFSGVVVAQTKYLTGCSRYGIASQKLDKEGKPLDWQYFDEDLLVSTGKNIGVKIKVNGGPVRMEAPQR